MPIEKVKREVIDFKYTCRVEGCKEEWDDNHIVIGCDGLTDDLCKEHTPKECDGFQCRNVLPVDQMFRSEEGDYYVS